jgi:hypothetical protein
VVQITLEELNLQIERLSHILVLPWFLNEKCSSFRTKVNELATCLEKYATFLCEQNKRTEKIIITLNQYDHGVTILAFISNQHMKTVSIKERKTQKRQL